MHELDILKIINNELPCSSYLGDDCAYLEELGLFVTHDTLVEDVHFSLSTISPFLLGRKSVAVNLSDLAAALCEPKYITISLSMPSNIKSKFIEEFYKGVVSICSEYGVKVIGGDLCASEKIVVSICALGKQVSSCISSRKYAKQGDYVIITGFHGSSSAGFHALSDFLQAPKMLIDMHLNPIPAIKESRMLSSVIDSNIAVMDTSDGLVDALYKISVASKHSIEIDINKVPVQVELLDFCEHNSLDYKKFVQWGGEDYQLLACVSEKIYKKLDNSAFTPIGKVLNKSVSPCVHVKDNQNTEKITGDVTLKHSFSHFITL